MDIYKLYIYRRKVLAWGSNDRLRLWLRPVSKTGVNWPLGGRTDLPGWSVHRRFCAMVAGRCNDEMFKGFIWPPSRTRVKFYSLLAPELWLYMIVKWIHTHLMNPNFILIFFSDSIGDSPGSNLFIDLINLDGWRIYNFALQSCRRWLRYCRYKIVTSVS